MVQCRKIVFHRERIEADGMGRPCGAVTRVVAMAVFANPFAGVAADDLSALFETGRALGERLSPEAAAMLPGPAAGYGKAALVGISGEIEHGAALIHPKLGAPMRAAIGGGAALIPSNARVGPTGAAIDIPLGHKDDAWSRDHFDTITVALADAPLPGEIVLCIAFADGGRPNPRCGQGPARR